MLMFMLLCTACSKQPKPVDNFVDRLIDLTIESSTGELVQLPELYEHLADGIPDDKDERSILVGNLKERGFKITGWGRGNMPPFGPRVVAFTLQRGSCVCEVTKAYYSTPAQDSAFQCIEGIRCSYPSKD